MGAHPKPFHQKGRSHKAGVLGARASVARLFALRFASGASGKMLPSLGLKPRQPGFIGQRTCTPDTLLSRVCVIVGQDSVESLGLPSIIIAVLPLPPVRKMQEK